MLRFFVVATLFFVCGEVVAQKKRLWLAVVVTVHSPVRHMGLMHSANDSLISILPGSTRKQLRAAIERNEQFLIPVNAIRKVKITKVRTSLGAAWQVLRWYLPLFVGSTLLVQPDEGVEVLALSVGSGAAAVALNNLVTFKVFKPDDSSFQFGIQKYCYYPSFRVPVEVLHKK